MKVFLSRAADFFLPRFCLNCNIKLESEIKFICSDCNSHIKETSDKFLSEEYAKKFSENELIDGFYSAFIFDKNSPLQKIIHSLKYSGNYKAGKHLGKLAALKHLNILEELNIDFIIPVPLHTTKKAERGFNQSLYIAKGISEVFNKPVSVKILKRKKFTVSQTGFNLDERKLNMENAFFVKQNKNIEGKSFLLTDDVITTGATIESCAKVLKEKKAKNIFAFSVAIPPDATSSRELKLQGSQDHF